VVTLLTPDGPVSRSGV